MMKPKFSLLWIVILACCCTTACGQDANPEPMKVFVLVGQSNMQGHARLHTLEHVGMDPATKPLFDMLANADGTPRVFRNVWINLLSQPKSKSGFLTAGFGADDGKIGPEFSFGARLHQLEKEPILIIKTAWGGKSLHTDFRPPSSGDFTFSKAQVERFRTQEKDIADIMRQKKEATGKHYRLMIDHVQNVLSDIESLWPDYDPKRGYKLAGMVWFQGWNDMVDSGVYPQRDKPGGYDEYSQLLAHFIQDVRKDLNSPDLPFVIGVMGVGGPTSNYSSKQKRYQIVHQNFRDAMAAPSTMPQFKSNVIAVRTETYWDPVLADLRSRQSQVQRLVRETVKDEGLDQIARKALQEKLLAEEFSLAERNELEKGISNLEFHYLGSAKILARIGVAFADAVFDLQK